MLGKGLSARNYYAVYDKMIFSFCTKDERDYFVFHVADKSRPIRLNSAFYMSEFEHYPIIEVKKARGERKRKKRNWVKLHGYKWYVL